MLHSWEPGAQDLVETKPCFSWTLSAQQSLTTATSRTCWLPRASWTQMKFLSQRVKWQSNWFNSMLRTLSFSLSSLPSPWLRWEIFPHLQGQGERSERDAGRSTQSIRLHDFRATKNSYVVCVFLLFQVIFFSLFPKINSDCKAWCGHYIVDIQWCNISACCISWNL